jgi:hypothetical protein
MVTSRPAVISQAYQRFTGRLRQGCSRLPRHHADQAALSYSDLLRQATGEGFSRALEPQRLTAPTEKCDRAVVITSGKMELLAGWPAD